MSQLRLYFADSQQKWVNLVQPITYVHNVHVNSWADETKFSLTFFGPHLDQKQLPAYLLYQVTQLMRQTQRFYVRTSYTKAQLYKTKFRILWKQQTKYKTYFHNSIRSLATSTIEEQVYMDR